MAQVMGERGEEAFALALAWFGLAWLGLNWLLLWVDLASLTCFGFFSALWLFFAFWVLAGFFCLAFRPFYLPLDILTSMLFTW